MYGFKQNMKKMTQITFTLKDESKLMLILDWLKNLDAVRDIVTTPVQLSRKQLEMKNDLEESLEWVEQVQRGEVEANKDAYQLLAELESMS